MSERKSITQKKTKSERKFKWRRYLCYLIIFVGLFYLLSLVLINTSWAKNKLTNRLHQKSNNDWEVGRVLWVPFGDIKLSDLQTQMGEGGVRIKTLSITPSWSDLFTGKLQLTGASVSDVKLDLDLKWFKDNSINKASINTEKVESRSTAPKLKTKQTPTKKQLATKPLVKPAIKPIPRPEDKEELKFDNTPSRWLKVTRLDITIRNGESTIAKFKDVTASIPYAGRPVEGEVRLKYNDHEITHKIHWDGRDLNAEESKGEFLTIHHQWKAACKIQQRGMPFIFVWKAPQQQLNYTLNKPNLHLSVTSDEVVADLVLKGRLKKLDTWRGIFNANTAQITISEDQKTHKRVYFDSTRLVGTIANGLIQLPVAEAIGFENSILANGVIQNNLYSYGVVRLVANEVSAKSFDRVQRATSFMRITEKSKFFLAPLDTPDRRYCDIYFDGKLTELEARHNRSNSWQSFNQALEKLINFKNRELREDGLLE